MSPRRPRAPSAETQPLTGRRFARSLDWNLLKTYHEIVDADGISEAARRTSRSQPAMSMALGRLEEQLATKLCQRGPGGLSLTHEGEVLAELCAAVYESVRGLPGRLAHMSTELRGRVRIQLISNLIDPAIDVAIDSFHRAHRNVEIFVSVTTWDVIKRSVLQNEVEIGIAPAQDKDSRLRYELLFREIYRPYCGRTHALFGKTLDGPKALTGEAIVLTGADEPDELSRFRMRYNIGRRVAGLSEHLEEAKRLTLLGVGVCFLPESFVAREVAEGNLCAVLARGEDPSSGIYLISNPGAPAHRAREVLLDHFRQATKSEQGPRRHVPPDH